MSGMGKGPKRAGIRQMYVIIIVSNCHNSKVNSSAWESIQKIPCQVYRTYLTGAGISGSGGGGGAPFLFGPFGLGGGASASCLAICNKRS